MAALQPTGSGVKPVPDALTLWLPEDWLRLLLLLKGCEAAALPATCVALGQQLRTLVAPLRQGLADADKGAHVLRCEAALSRLESVLLRADQVPGSPASPAVSWQSAWDDLTALETSLHSEMRYLHALDWEMKPGKLVSKKGTFLKMSTLFSWELSEAQKLYVPHGVVMPVLQISQVVDPVELRRHEWVSQHLRVWLKPSIVQTLEDRRQVWFIYAPHWQEKGPAIVALVDTWLKKTTQMSGELQPFELIIVPKGMPVRLAREPSPVDEQWEMFRHQHVHMHRKVVLAGRPRTIVQDRYEIIISTSDANPGAPQQ